MFRLQLRIPPHRTNQENLTNSQGERESTNANQESIQVMDLSSKDVKADIFSILMR